MQFSVYPDPDNSGCDRVGLSLTLPQHGQQQQHEEQQQPPASSQASSKGGKRPQKAADDDLAASWLFSHSWGKYTGKRTPAGHRHATCSICLEHNHVSLTPVFCLTLGYLILAATWELPLPKSSTTLAKYHLKRCLNISALRKPPKKYSKFRIRVHILQLWQSFSLSKK